MNRIKLAIVAQRATKYNKIIRKLANGEDQEWNPALEKAESALEKALNDVITLGYIGIIWTGELIDQIIVGDNLLEIR